MLLLRVKAKMAILFFLSSSVGMIFVLSLNLLVFIQQWTRQCFATKPTCSHLLSCVCLIFLISELRFLMFSACLVVNPASNNNGTVWTYDGAVRDCIGDSSLSGDLRWAGTFGVNLDFVARSHCSVEFISIEDMQASFLARCS